MRVIEAARDQVAFAGTVQLQNPTVTFTRAAGVWVCEQIHFAG